VKKAVIPFAGTIVVYPDGDEYEGGDMSSSDAQGWVWHALARGDKHASNFISYGGPSGPVTFEDYDSDE
jgi:hypothetical protein